MNHPIYEKTLLPANYSVKYKIFNPDGMRRIIIAGLVSKGKVLSTGHAICSPQDEYIEERGMAIAKGRAIKTWWLQLEPLQQMMCKNAQDLKRLEMFRKANT